MPKIAFDIGSTMTKVVVGSEVVFQQSTCLALDKNSGSVAAFGNHAYSLLGKTAKKLEIFFPVVAGVVADIKNLNLYLTLVLKELDDILPKNLTSLLLGHQAVVAYSPCSTPAQKIRLQTVFRQLGLRTQFKIRPETISAKNICLLDIGGSTAICSIVANGAHVQSYKIPWGGIQLTQSIQKYLLREIQLTVGWHEAERLKLALAAVLHSQTLAKYRDHKYAVRGQDFLTHIGKTVLVSREQLAQVVQPQMENLLAGVTEFLSLLPREMASGVLESGITLIGGGSKLAGIAEFLQEELACKVSVLKYPDLVSVRGL